MKNNNYESKFRLRKKTRISLLLNTTYKSSTNKQVLIRNKINVNMTWNTEDAKNLILSIYMNLDEYIAIKKDNDTRSWPWIEFSVRSGQSR